MNNRLKIFFVLMVVIIVVFGVFIFFRQRPHYEKGPSQSQQGQRALDSQRQQELEEEYKNQVNEILGPYFNKEEFLNPSQKLSELTVPLQFRDLHLELVIAFSMIEEGRRLYDQDKIEEGIFRIEELVKKYEWLMETITSP